MAAQPIPEGYHTVTPYLAVDNAAEAIEYYRKAFGAEAVSNTQLTLPTILRV
jgi:PhnB protein